MKAAVWKGPYKLSLEEMSVQEPGRGEVLIKTKAVGICETDIEIYSGRFPQSVPPMVMGHEGGGTIEELGPDVTGFEIGERVMAECITYCGECYFCKRGTPWLCDNVMIKGVEGEGTQGEYADYFTVPARNCHRLPETISWREAGLIDTLACPVHAIHKIEMPLAATVAVFGPGPAGLFFTRMAKLRGARQVILVGTRENRLQLGKQYGADETINIHDADPAAVILELTGGRGVDLVIEASGNERAFNDGLKTVRKGGQFLIYGVFGGGPISTDIQNIQRCEFTIIGAAGADYTTAIDLVARGEIALKPLITHTFSLEELPEAFSSGLIAERKDNYIKGTVLFAEE